MSLCEIFSQASIGHPLEGVVWRAWVGCHGCQASRVWQLGKGVTLGGGVRLLRSALGCRFVGHKWKRSTTSRAGCRRGCTLQVPCSLLRFYNDSLGLRAYLTSGTGCARDCDVWHMWNRTLVSEFAIPSQSRLPLYKEPQILSLWFYSLEPLVTSYSGNWISWDWCQHDHQHLLLRFGQVTIPQAALKGVLRPCSSLQLKAVRALGFLANHVFSRLYRIN